MVCCQRKRVRHENMCHSHQLPRPALPNNFISSFSAYSNTCNTWPYLSRKRHERERQVDVVCNFSRGYETGREFRMSNQKNCPNSTPTFVLALGPRLT